MTGPLLLIIAALLLAADPATDAASCEAYEVRGVRIGMTPGEVWKILGGPGQSSGTREDPAGPATLVSYTRRDQPVDIEYDRAPISKKSGSVVLVRDRAVAEALRSPSTLLERFGAPSSGADLLESRFDEGDTVLWVDTRCGVVVRAFRRRPEWWDSGGETLAIEILSMERGLAAGHVIAGQVRSRPDDPGVAITAAGDAPARPAGSEPRAAGVGGVSVPQRIPSSYVEPVYPRLPRAMGIEGVVTLRLIVDRDGMVSQAQVDDNSSSRPEFEEAALNAARVWRYRPAVLDGAPVESELIVRIEFKR